MESRLEAEVLRRLPFPAVTPTPGVRAEPFQHLAESFSPAAAEADESGAEGQQAEGGRLWDVDVQTDV